MANERPCQHEGVPSNFLTEIARPQHIDEFMVQLGMVRAPAPDEEHGQHEQRDDAPHEPRDDSQEARGMELKDLSWGNSRMTDVLYGSIFKKDRWEVPDDAVLILEKHKGRWCYQDFADRPDGDDEPTRQANVGFRHPGAEVCGREKEQEKGMKAQLQPTPKAMPTLSFGSENSNNHYF